jgi:hypothetical protein
LFDSLCSYVPNFKLRHILHADARKDSTVSLHDELALPGAAGSLVIVVVPLKTERKRFRMREQDLREANG